MPLRVVSKAKSGIAARAGEQIIYIGRPSVLGNPFAMSKESDREDVISKYRDWLRARYAEHGDVYKELQRLAMLERDGKPLALQCWCAPRACHGDVIIEAITGINAKEAGARGS